MFRFTTASRTAAALSLVAACAGAQEAPRVTKDAPASGAAPAALPLKHAPRPTAAPITAADLMTRLYIFADDSMMGREAGTEGNRKGNAYIVRELQRLGLRPAGENGTYLQTVPYVRRSVDPNATITVENETLRFGTDFVASGGTSTRSIDGVGTIYGGRLGPDGLAGLTAEQANGKLVVLTAQTLANTQALSRLPALQGAAGVALVLLDQLPPPVRAQLARPALAVDPAAFAAAGATTGAPPADAPLVLIVT
ncbi:hypothetical protein PYV61_06715, partial [Roseisolibacter sp. H3M3-2]